MKCISAEWAKINIGRVCFCRCLDEETENDLINAIDETRAEDVKRNVYGEWLDCDAMSENFEFCNMCGWENDAGARHYNFCPNCGTDMRGETETGINRDVETIITGDTDSDYVKVVRCKDCMYFKAGICMKEDITYGYLFGDPLTTFEPDEDFWCKYGVRRTEK